MTDPTGWRLHAERAVLPEGDGLRVGPATVDVVGSRIVAVHAGAAPPADPALSDVDLQDRLLSPAFIDGHTHLALTALRGLALPEAAEHNLVEDFFYRIESSATPEDVRAFARMGAYEALLAGTGMVLDHYYHADEVAHAVAEVGLSAVIAPTLQDIHGPGVEQLEAAFASARRIHADAALRDAGIVAALGPHATDTVSVELFGRVGDLAADLGIPVHAHLAQSVDEVIRTRERLGLSPMEVLERSGVLERAPRLLLVHAVLLSDAELQRLPTDRAVLAFCPHSKQIFAYLPDIRTWLDAGIPWVLGTDCAASNDAGNIQRELRFAAGLRTLPVTYSAAHQRFLASGTRAHAEAAWTERATQRDRTARLGSPEYLLDRVWRIPGNLHPGAPAGVIAPGRLANLVVWDTRHPAFWPDRAPLRALVLSDTVGAIHAVMTAGRWRGEPGRFAASVVESEAYREARAEATGRLRALERRAGRI